ncbi:deazaflavin-dependent oxidoreductase (nitroreductase family) [Actinomycetospora succinea]|uniref:Deazaflavin-dependent oxidoreductase (Nitroreductase family) n=1 Tax=Actinomycetospora succinea TaxID=663603 RepID=A0A4R6VBB0_9PSEU|nr:nitroreductase family deazaflavin-dependent oxidoreductase [Actinomycetospora succinea]TDQ58925.1 deazaflavin-dependent oxidoreductase (nitroreductase family) [Actinomycetospora succinea]
MRTAEPARRAFSRALVRAPVLVYRCGLGWVFGRRLVLLTHIGRRSGRPRHVALEVVGRGEARDSYVVASGYGARAQWFRNVLAHPEVSYQVGRRRRDGWAYALPSAESGRRLAEYATRHPRAAAALMRMLDHDVDGSPGAYERLGADAEHGVPLVLLSPTPLPRPAPATPRPPQEEPPP